MTLYRIHNLHYGQNHQNSFSSKAKTGIPLPLSGYVGPHLRAPTHPGCFHVFFSGYPWRALRESGCGPGPNAHPLIPLAALRASRRAKRCARKLGKQDEIGTKITSPIIGTAYLAPEPGAKKFIDVGTQIKKGQTVMIVEAMKTMNHVPSPSSGIVKKILVQDGEAVEFGQTLVLLK